MAVTQTAGGGGGLTHSARASSWPPLGIAGPDRGPACRFARSTWRGSRPRRIWAIARLSFKEAVRRRVLWASSPSSVVFLFPPTGSCRYKPEDQLQTYVTVIYWAMTPLCCSRPALLRRLQHPDRHQATRPSTPSSPSRSSGSRSSWGGSWGTSALMTLVLVVLTALSLVYVARGVDPDAEVESCQGPRAGVRRFLTINNPASVGREWEYRSYVGNPPAAATGRAGPSRTCRPGSLDRPGGTGCPASSPSTSSARPGPLAGGGEPGHPGLVPVRRLAAGDFRSPDDPTLLSRLDEYTREQQFASGPAPRPTC